MRSLTTVCGVTLMVLTGALAIGCEDDGNGSSGGGGGEGNAAGSGEPSDGGTPSTGASSNTGGKAGSAGAAGSGEGGEVSMGGTAPSDGGEPGNPGGAPTGEGGGGGVPGEPVDPNLCENFPITLTGGPTISVDTTGIVLCLDPCRVTTNTYSDGEGACPASAGQVAFITESGQSPTNFASLRSTWTFESATAGTIDQGFAYYLNGVPFETEITAVISDPDQNEYTVVFSFPGNGQITVTSFTEN